MDRLNEIVMIHKNNFLERLYSYARYVFMHYGIFNLAQLRNW